MIQKLKLYFRPGFPGPPGMCGPRLGLPLPPPPFLDFYGMPGGLDGNYRKVRFLTSSCFRKIPKNKKASKCLREALEIFENFWKIFIIQKINFFF